MARTNLPIAEQCRIEANIIKSISAGMVEKLAEKTAKKILGEAVKKTAVAQGKT